MRGSKRRGAVNSPTLALLVANAPFARPSQEKSYIEQAVDWVASFSPSKTASDEGTSSNSLKLKGETPMDEPEAGK